MRGTRSRELGIGFLKEKNVWRNRKRGEIYVSKSYSGFVVYHDGGYGSRVFEGDPFGKCAHSYGGSNTVRRDHTDGNSDCNSDADICADRHTDGNADAYADNCFGLCRTIAAQP